MFGGILNFISSSAKTGQIRAILLNNYNIGLQPNNEMVILEICKKHGKLFNNHELAIMYLAYDLRNFNPNHPDIAQSAQRWFLVAKLALKNGWVRPEVVNLLSEGFRLHLGLDLESDDI